MNSENQPPVSDEDRSTSESVDHFGHSDQGDPETHSFAEASFEQLPAEQQVSVLLQQNAELEDRVTRVQAEMVNYRRRVQNEIDQFRKYEGLNLIRELLPTIDNLQRAVAAAQQSTEIDNLRAGVEMVARQLVETLGKFQVEVISTAGAAFDPNLHDAILQQPSAEIPAMHILAEVETGYKMQDRIVRPAKVVVSTGPAASGDSTAAE